MRRPWFNYRQEYIPHAYLELCIPPTSDDDVRYFTVHTVWKFKKKKKKKKRKKRREKKRKEKERKKEIGFKSFVKSVLEIWNVKVLTNPNCKHTKPH